MLKLLLPILLISTNSYALINADVAHSKSSTNLISIRKIQEKKIEEIVSRHIDEAITNGDFRICVDVSSFKTSVIKGEAKLLEKLGYSVEFDDMNLWVNF